jgi:hypothetical protein
MVNAERLQDEDRGINSVHQVIIIKKKNPSKTPGPVIFRYPGEFEELVLLAITSPGNEGGVPAAPWKL